MSTDSPQIAPPLTPVKSGNRRFATGRTVLALMLREMSTSYGRTPGGYIWAILEPLGAIMVLTLAFSLIVRSPPLGTSFILFYATAYQPFDLYQNLARTTGFAIRFSKPLLKYPAVTWVDAILARFLLNSLTSVLVTILLLGGILATIETRTILDIPPMVQAIGLSMALGLGIGTLNCAIMGLFPLWEMIWSILTRPLFIASGIFFLFDTLPMLAQEILWYNPLIHITGLMRTGFYPTYAAEYVDKTYVLSLSLILLVMGLILLGRYHRDILNR